MRTKAAIDELREEHINEKWQHFVHHENLEKLERNKLHDLYKIKEQREAILIQMGKTRNPSLWRRVSGKARQDRIELGNLLLQYKQSKDEINEGIERMESDRAQDLGRLTERQNREMHAFLEDGPNGLRSERNATFEREQQNKNSTLEQMLDGEMDFEP